MVLYLICMHYCTCNLSLIAPWLKKKDLTHDTCHSHTYIINFIPWYLLLVHVPSLCIIIELHMCNKCIPWYRGTMVPPTLQYMYVATYDTCFFLERSRIRCNKPRNEHIYPFNNPKNNEKFHLALHVHVIFSKKNLRLSIFVC